MGLIKNLFNKAIDNITPQWLIQLIDEDFMKAFAGATALIACADGKIDNSEEEKIRNYIRNTKNLKGFDVETVMKHFKEYADAIMCDLQMGQEIIYKALDEIKDERDSAKLLIRACCAIGAADGNFDADERKVVKDICNRLNLDPRNFNL